MRDRVDGFALLCERCGYSVEGLPREGACPECGKAIAESLPERRCATPTLWGVLRHPLRSLDSMPIEWQESTAPRMVRRCALGAFMAAMSVPVGMALLAWVASEPLEYLADCVLAFFVAGAVGVFLFGLLVLLCEVEAAGLRFLGGRRGWRITKEVSRTICSHGSVGWVVAGAGFALAVLSFATGVLIDESGLGASGVPQDLSRAIGMGGLWVGLAVTLSGFLVFETFAWLGLRRCRFANRARTDAIENPGEYETPP
jgi:hypothetical protein